MSVLKKSDFSEEQCSSLKVILGSKHVGAILYVLMKKFYICALVGVLIKCLYEMHGATIKITTCRRIGGVEVQLHSFLTSTLDGSE